MFFFSLTIKQVLRLLGVAFWSLVICGLIAIVCGIGWGLLALALAVLFITAVFRVLRTEE